MIDEINNLILKTAPKHRVAQHAPNTFADLYTGPRRELVIWCGGSDNTIFADQIVNYAFRALHDKLHLATGIGFSVQEEVYLGRLQASKYEGLMADLVYCEVALQAEYYLQHGVFVPNQVDFTKTYLLKQGYKV